MSAAGIATQARHRIPSAAWPSPPSTETRCLAFLALPTHGLTPQLVYSSSRRLLVRIPRGEDVDVPQNSRTINLLAQCYGRPLMRCLAGSVLFPFTFLASSLRCGCSTLKTVVSVACPCCRLLPMATQARLDNQLGMFDNTRYQTFGGGWLR
jgi:hypothetical protein